MNMIIFQILFILICPGVLSLKNIKFFSYNELRSATDGFHPRHKLGRGGFGTVYKVSLYLFILCVLFHIEPVISRSLRSTLVLC